MTLYLRLAWRNIWRHQRRTIIIMLAMGLSLALMMWYDGLMDGFNQAIYGNAIRVLGGNIQIHAEGYRAKCDSNPLLPLAMTQAVIKAALSQPASDRGHAANRTRAEWSPAARARSRSSIIGIEPEAEATVNLIGQNVKEGRWLTSDDLDIDSDRARSCRCDGCEGR